MTTIEKIREEIEKTGGRFRGRKELIGHLSGEDLTPRQMVLAKCYDCMGHFTDGSMDCKAPACPCYQLMPYRESKPERKRKRVMSAEQRQATVARLEKAREIRAGVAR